MKEVRVRLTAASHHQYWMCCEIFSEPAYCGNSEMMVDRGSRRVKKLSEMLPGDYPDLSISYVIAFRSWSDK